MKYSSILAIDVASDKLDFCWKKDHKLRYKSVSYTEKSLEGFLSEHSEINFQETVIGMESTGDYHLLVAKYFLEKKFIVKILNPILTNHKIRLSVRGKKTDKEDSKKIYSLIEEGEGTPKKLSDIFETKKTLLRLSSKLTKINQQLTLIQGSLKRKNLNRNKDLIKAEKDVQKLINSVEKISNKIIENETKEQSDEERFIDSIPGFAAKLSSIINSEIGDVNRFKNINSLIAFAGLDPRIKQSGKNLNTTGHLTKRGTPHLRTALFLGANVARRYDSELKKYYEKKKAENRTYKEITCMIARKLLRRIYAVLKDKRLYLKT